MLVVKFAVTQPYHGPGGELLLDVGDLLDPAKVPDGVTGRMVVTEKADKPAPKAPPEPAKAPAA